MFFLVNQIHAGIFLEKQGCTIVRQPLLFFLSSDELLILDFLPVNFVAAK